MEGHVESRLGHCVLGPVLMPVIALVYYDVLPVHFLRSGTTIPSQRLLYAPQGLQGVEWHLSEQATCSPEF